MSEVVAEGGAALWPNFATAGPGWYLVAKVWTGGPFVENSRKLNGFPQLAEVVAEVTGGWFSFLVDFGDRSSVVVWAKSCSCGRS